MKKTVLAVWTKVPPNANANAASLQDQLPLRTFQKFKNFLPVPLVLLFLLLAGASRAQQWQILGNESQVSSVAASYTSITVLDDVPYVVFREGTAGAKVKKRNSATGAWEQVGNSIGTNVTFSRLYLDKTGNLYVTYVDGASSNKLAVRVYNSESQVWEPLNNNSANLYVSIGTVNGMSGVSQYSSTPRSSLAFDSDNNPYIAFSEGSNITPYVKKFDGTSWVTVGVGAVDVAAKAVAVSLVIDETDVPWLTFVSQSSATATTGTMALYRFGSGVWTPVTVTLTSGIRHTSMALNSAGNLAIAFFNTGNSNRASVIVYNKSANTWSSATALSSRDAPNISLISDISGNLYCSFIDAFTTAFNSVGRVFKQSAGTTAWKELRDPNLTRGIDEPIGNLTISVGSDTAKPFIVYTKTNSSSVSTPVVRMFIPPAAPAVLSTNEVSNIAFGSAVAGGDVTSDGGSVITERGVVFGTSINPTTANGKVVAASAGTGAFTVNLTGLTPSTYYYVRAYAINAGGTTYGSNVNVFAPAAPDAVVNTPKQMEFLTRGVVAVRRTSSSVFVSWRLLGNDPSNIAFNIYRDGVKLNAVPITTSTNYLDNTSDNGTYTVKPVINGVEGAASAPATVWASNQMTVPLQIPAAGTLPDGRTYTYTANDASVGDVDGDGTYEIILRWAPTIENHNSGGYSGKQLFDCYRLDGTLLWRIDLGINMNAGPHFNQFMVYDFDGDGKAEIILKTADGTIDGTGNVIGNATVDYRSTSGWVQQGPEYLTVFNGLTGAAMATVNYEPALGNVSDWGDNYGNRADRFVSAVAYLDGARPSLIVGRGYYNKLARAAYNWRDGKLTLLWKFDSKEPGNDIFSSMGNHQMTIGDVDGDGKDEVINGSSVINDNGKGLWTTGKGHGDALHMTDMDPDRPGQEIWINLESPSQYTPYGLRQYDAKTGATNWGVATTGDVGRSMAGDIDPSRKGYEMWGSSGNLYDAKGNQISTNKPTYNFGIWWDGDLGRELLDGTKIDRWNYTTNSLNRVFTVYLAAPISTNNDTKANPCLQADLFGDWREEVIYRYSNNTALVIFTTNTPTEHRIPTLMHDAQYRTAVAWQNSAYNQPPYPSFYIGYDMATPPMPNIDVKDIVAPEVSLINRQDPDGAQTNAASVTYRVVFTENVSGVDAGDFSLNATGNLTGTIASVTAVSGSVYDVTVNELTGEGDLRLDLNESNTAIVDGSNNALAAGFTAGEIFTRFKNEQTITFDALEGKTVGDDDVTLAATATSGLPVSYSSSNPDVATVNGGTLHIVGAGNATITASQDGDNFYKAATAVARELTVVKKDQTITFDAFTQKQVGDADFAAGASATSGLDIAYSSSNTDVAVVENGIIHIVGAGTTAITASQEGNYMYNAAASVEQILTVVKKDQAITFGALGQKYVGDEFELSATASSNLAVSYSSSNPDVATITGTTVHVLSAGSTVITATQNGNDMYHAAASVEQTLAVVKKSQSITFDKLDDKAYGAADFDAGAVASSGLAVTYASSNTDVATIVNGKVHITGLGTTLISAAQEGNYMYEAAQTAVQSLTVKDMTAPGIPQALTTTKTADGRVALMWQPSTDDIGVKGYYIYLNRKQLNAEPVTATSFITDAPAGSLVYSYTVIAADAAGNHSDESASALFTNSNGNGVSNQSLEILKVFPNPNDGNFKVRLNSGETGTVVIAIYNNSGVLVQSVSEGKSGDVYQRQFNLQSMPKGMYLVKVAVGNFVQTSIVIIQ